MSFSFGFGRFILQLLEFSPREFIRRSDACGGLRLRFTLLCCKMFQVGDEGWFIDVSTPFDSAQGKPLNTSGSTVLIFGGAVSSIDTGDSDRLRRAGTPSLHNQQLVMLPLS